jgi:hypothetical protein
MKYYKPANFIGIIIDIMLSWLEYTTELILQ